MGNCISCCYKIEKDEQHRETYIDENSFKYNKSKSISSLGLDFGDDILLNNDTTKSIDNISLYLENYRNLESRSIENGNDGLISDLILLREKPRLYLFSDNIKIRELAKTREEIYTELNKLGVDFNTLNKDNKEKQKQPQEEQEIINPLLSQTKSSSLSSKSKSLPTDPLFISWKNKQKTNNMSIKNSNSKTLVKTNQNNTKPLINNHKWPEWLLDETYDVVKTNKYGSKYERKLTLTQIHILASREGIGVTQVYTYLDVEKVYLNKDESQVVIFFKTNKKSFFYTSPQAANIAQQIATRVQVRVSMEKSNDLISSIIRGYTKEKMLLLMNEISDESDKSNSSNFASFANILKNKVLPQELFGLIQSDPLLDVLPSNSASNISNLMDIEKNSGKYRLQVAIREILFDTTSPEGNTRRVFLEEFSIINNNKTIEDYRIWIDGMHEFLFLNRGPLLCYIYNSGLCGEPTQVNANSNLSESLQELALILLKNYDEETLSVVSFIVYTIVEESVYLPLKANLTNLLQNTNALEVDSVLSEKLTQLSSKTQLNWKICENNISSLSWNSAIFELEGIERNPTPTTKLNAIVRAAKAIYIEFRKEVLPRLTKQGKTDVVLGADDLLPIFLFVISNSNLRNPLLNKELLWNLCDPDQLLDEAGYYLTLYTSAVEYIIHADINTLDYSDDGKS
jgi:hypothetical protein